MEDIEDRRDVVAPMKVKLVVTPALLQLTGASGDRIKYAQGLKEGPGAASGFIRRSARLESVP